MDCRDAANNIPKWYESLNNNTMKATVILFEDDEETEIEIPFKYEVCNVCRGTGSHINPDIDRQGLFYEDFEDPGFREDYFSGVYDVDCYQCHGQKVVAEIDDEYVSDETKNLIDKFKKQRERQVQDIYDDLRTMQMECGYY